MKTSYPLFSFTRRLWVCLWPLACATLALAQSVPTIVSTVPANFATGVSPTAPVVITFSEEMDPEYTSVDFYDSSTFAQLATLDSWNPGHTVLTCTPSPSFPANRMIVWSASGLTPGGEPLGGEGGGIFTTGSGGGTGGSGTNRVTTFSIGESHTYVQTSAADAVIDAEIPYGFVAQTLLASNRTANAITLLLPTAAVSNLVQSPGKPEQWLLLSTSLSQSTLDATFPNGNYTFTVTAPTSNQQVTVTLPSTVTQPPVPHIANFEAAQSVDASQPFTLQWDALAGGASAQYIFVQIGAAFRTPEPDAPGALNGAATSVMIPAGTLQPNTTYEGTVGYYRASTNAFGTSHVTAAFRSTFTRFTLVTSGVAGNALILTNAAWNGFFFSFDVLSAPGQRYTVDSAITPGGPWLPLLTTNAPPSGRVEVFDLNSFNASAQFYRARNSP
jgi:hypothetical protein